MRWIAVFMIGLSACATGNPEYVTPNQRHPSADLSDQFFPDNGMPQGNSHSEEFFSKKCSARSSSTKTEYFCEQR